ncbi:MAG TPA: tyrosine-type recombinase/integrase [Devosia sp.]|jgi:integrase|nr:tyrosine-type recombinase/integrase [Devosia sp.]
MADAVTPFFLPNRNGPTFAMAAQSYLGNGGERRYLPRILDHMGEVPVAEITPYAIYEMAKALFPTQSGATRNRQALSPARAVMIHAYERGWCPLIRVRRFKEEPRRRKQPASQAWLHVFCRQRDKDGLSHLAALVIFMSHTGARVSEATRLRWSEVDLVGRKAVLLRTKTETNSVRHLTDELVMRLHQLKEEADLDEPVFRYRCRFSVNERIAAVCRRAEIPYKSSHACGRHSFATNAIGFGMDVRTAMDAGGWKSSSIFIETYVHSRNAGRLVADRFNAYQFSVEL